MMAMAGQIMVAINLTLTRVVFEYGFASPSVVSPTI